MGSRQRRFTLFPRGPANRFDGLYAERLDRRKQSFGFEDAPRACHFR
jgi:hypothetical protein